MRTLTLSLALLAGCSAALANPAPDDLVAEASAAAPRSPAAFAELLARYDALAPGPEREALAHDVDAMAGQRYATVSRLFWYTDLPTAEAEAQRRHVPILSLRMLGELDQDLSCANSRLFRATLYANHDVSAFLRDHFVLHWSSERDVPRVTIDFGDGRKLERTTTGNSAHYVLDEHGHVLDVLPGLYAPIAFRRELTADLALADQVRPLGDAARAQAIVDYQTASASAADTWRRQLAGMIAPRGHHRLLTTGDISALLALAQRAAMSKAAMEVPDLATFGMAPGTGGAEDVASWASAGQRMYGIGGLDQAPLRVDYSGWGSAPAAHAAPTVQPHVLDDASRALITRLHDAVPRELVATPAQHTALLDRLEEHIVADTAQNQLELRPKIAAHIIATHGRESFEDLNRWIYDEVFHTPRTDAWLGLLPRTDFSGLPGDGIVTR